MTWKFYILLNWVSPRHLTISFREKYICCEQTKRSIQIMKRTGMEAASQRESFENANKMGGPREANGPVETIISKQYLCNK